jgi:hypothetical protein
MVLTNMLLEVIQEVTDHEATGALEVAVVFDPAQPLARYESSVAISVHDRRAFRVVYDTTQTLHRRTRWHFLSKLSVLMISFTEFSPTAVSSSASAWYSVGPPRLSPGGVFIGAFASSSNAG